MTKDQGQPKIPGEPEQPREPQEPFAPKEVKKRLIRCIPDTVTFSHHALERMGERDIQTTDVFNVMRGGTIRDDFSELTAGRWRYCVATSKFRIVFVFDDCGVVIITAIRLETKP